MMTPRWTVAITVWVKLLTDVYSAKKRSSAAPIVMTPPSNPFSSKVTVISMPRAALNPFAWRRRRTTGRLLTLCIARSCDS
jgi:hypothetical protein